MRLLSVSSLLLVAAVQASTENHDRFMKLSGTPQDQAECCRAMADLVNQRLEATKHREEEMVEIGVRLGDEGENVTKKTVRYADSEKRYFDVFEDLCAKNPKKSLCVEMLYKFDDDITAWFGSGRAESFEKAICAKRISSFDSLKPAADEVEVESEEKGKAATKAASEQKKETPKNADAPKKEQEKTTSEPAFDVIAMIEKVVNRFKNNMIRIRYLSVELYNEVMTAYRTGKWEPLKAQLKDANFYKKYYLVFVAFFAGLYFMFSLYESIFGAAVKPAAPRRGQVRDLRSSPAKASRSTGSAKPKKDE